MKTKEIEGVKGLAKQFGGAAQLSPDAARRAGREPIELWPLMQWAYNDEMVRFTCGADFRPAAVSQSTLQWAMAAARAGVVEGDCDADYDFAPCSHEDALAVHGHVLRVIDRQERGQPRREAFKLLILHTEARVLPTWDVPEPTWRVVPVMRKKGKVQHWYGSRNEPMGCLIECVGEIAGLDVKVRSIEGWRELRDRARERYGLWISLLDDVMHSLGREQLSLSRWRVKGLGVERQPWALCSQRAA